MECTCIRHTELPNTSKLFADFVYHFDRVSSFYAHSPFDPAGYATAASQIDLPGDRRTIQSVDLWYSKGRWTRRPTVGLYGIR